MNDLHIIPVVLGDALQMAEDEVKSKSRKIGLTNIPYNLNLKGMECKWDKIAPPVDSNEILTLIIKAQTTALQSTVYSEVLTKMEFIYGDVKKRHPITIEKLIMINSLGQLKNEVLMKFSELKWVEVFTSAIRSFIARWYLKTNEKGRNYLRELPELTESLMVDGTINTVISGTAKQRELLIFELQAMQDKNLLRYGYYVSNTSVLSCYVTAIDDYHVHFLDGDQGGYTQASKLLKL
ncbi:Mlr3260 protein [Nonlabens ulvanivorans]|uniref:Mlr3260 protein n=1 Tax=Nonlabens ulvanivorans TaxID=906888 RepID=A0A090QFZ2_NONUL|nr:Mlr3260 protein [Nonlabens ulvanivorans]